MNITDPIRRVARLSPNAPAVLDFGAIVTYAQLNAVVDSLAGRMLGMGLAPGQAAGVLVSSSYALLVLALGLARIGVAAVLSRDVIRGVGGLSLKTCFVDAARASEVAAGGVLVDDTWLRGPAAAGQPAAVPSRPGGKAVCIVVTSSGTTGVPKAIALSHDLLRARLSAKWLAVRTPDPARQICTLGLESFYGFSTVLRTLWTGGLVATAIKWSDIHVAIPLYQLNSLVMSPVQLGRLLSELPPGAGPFSSLQAVEIGGSTLPPRVAVQARARLCGNVHVSYGAAELAYVAGASVDILESQPGAVGFVAAGVEVQAVDADHRPMPPGTEGALRIRSATCIDAYTGDPEASALVFRDGWFYPGDVGSVSSDGLLAVAGRAGEMINAGGVKVSPRYIEDIVLQNPDVGEAAAFAMPNAATGVEEIWVAIVQRNPVNVDALHGFCVQRLGHRAPRSFLLADQLPRNENGKVLRDQLVKMAAAASKIAAGTGKRP